jgi:ADP-heptose:LPS heptosyltransferase
MEKLELFFKKILIGIIVALRPHKKILPDALPLSHIKRILIVKQHDQLGDLLVTTPAIRALRKRFPNAFIAIVVREYTMPMIWENPNVDSIIVFYEKLKRWDRHKIQSFWNQLRSDGGFDCAFMFNSVSRSLSSDLIAVISKAKYIIGPNHIPLDVEIPESIYNVTTPRIRKIQHESEHYLDIVRPLGIKADGLDYDLHLTTEEESEADRILYDIGIQNRMLTIGVHFGALNKEKRYPLDKLATAIKWIKENYICEILPIIGPREIQQQQELLNRLRNKELRTMPVLSLREACAVIKKLNLLICNDTSMLHIASACQVSTISFHSITDPIQWKPVHERHVALRAADKKIGSITIDMVTSAVQSQLEKLGFKRKDF